MHEFDANALYASPPLPATALADALLPPCHAAALLPVELWIIIVNETSRNALLSLAGVCALLNTLCMDRYLKRYGSDLPMVWCNEGTELITGTKALRVLAGALTPPRIEHLHCSLEQAVSVHADLAVLNKLLPRLADRGMHQLSLNLEVNLLSLDPQHPNLDRMDFVRVVCAILTGMVRRLPNRAPIVVIGKRGMFLHHDPGADLDDGWLFSLFQIRRDRAGAAPGFYGVLSSLSSAQVILVPPGARDGIPDGLAVVVFDYTKLVSLSISDDPENSDRSTPGLSIPIAYLIALIPRLHLRNLQELLINTDSIPATVLANFVRRHSRLETFIFRPKRKEQYSSLLRWTHAIALPQLRRIAATDMQSLSEALYSLGSSPELSTVETYFNPSVDSLEALLPVSSMLGDLPDDRKLTLTVTLLSPSSSGNGHVPPEPSTSVDRDIAQAAHELRCLDSITLRASTATLFYHLLPWITLLPKLSRAHFVLHPAVPYTADTAAHVNQLDQFLTDARVFLSNVSKVDGNVHWEPL